MTTFSLYLSWCKSEHRDQSLCFERLARAFAVDFYLKGYEYFHSNLGDSVVLFCLHFGVDRQSSQALYDLCLFGSFVFVSRVMNAIVTERIEKGNSSTTKKIMVVFHWYSLLVVLFRLGYERQYQRETP